MSAEIPHPDERESAPQILSEDEYFNQCVEYGTGLGWIKPGEKDILIEKYLSPIHQKYLELIGEVKQEVSQQEDGEAILASVIKKLNICLEQTKRIGCTDPQNILRSIADYYRFACQDETYTEYAVHLLHQTITQVLSK